MIFITENWNCEKLKSHTTDNLEAYSPNTGILFHWVFLTALKSCSCRAQPPLPEHTPAQFQTWRVLPVLSQLPQQPDPCPGWSSTCPAPSPQWSGQRCHPELQPGMCLKLPESLTPEIMLDSSQEPKLFGSHWHMNVCLYFLSCSKHLKQGGVTTLIFLNLKWVDLHSKKIILNEKAIYMPVLLTHLYAYFGDSMFRYLRLKISLIVLIRSPN